MIMDLSFKGELGYPRSVWAWKIQGSWWSESPLTLERKVQNSTGKGGSSLIISGRIYSSIGLGKIRRIWGDWGKWSDPGRKEGKGGHPAFPHRTKEWITFLHPSQESWSAWCYIKLEGVDFVGPMDTFLGFMGPFGLTIQSKAPYGFRLDLNIPMWEKLLMWQYLRCR